MDNEGCVGIDAMWLGATEKDVAKGLIAYDGGWEVLPNGAEGLWRIVLDGIPYRPPPFPNGVPQWTQDPSSRRLFRMVLPTRPQRIFTLRGYCDSLLQQSRDFAAISCSTPILPEPLRLLDQIVGKILDLVESLHEAGHGIGLLAPENIVIFDWGSDVCVTFSDLGFFWDDPLAPAIPTWLESDPAVNPYAVLWESPRKQIKEFDPQRDLRVLGRVFCSALLGRPYDKVPSPDENPLTRAQPKRIPFARRVWVVLEEMINGDLLSLQEVREKLEEYPLSQHYLREVRSRHRLWAAAASVVVIALVAVAALRIGCPPPPPAPRDKLAKIWADYHHGLSGYIETKEQICKLLGEVRAGEARYGRDDWKKLREELEWILKLEFGNGCSQTNP